MNKIITDADVIAFLRSKRVDLSADVTVHAYVSPGSPDGNFLISSTGSGSGSGNSPSLDEALRQFKASIKTPEERAAKLRADAAKMMADADALAPTPAREAVAA